jgi:hypothetical protein
MELNNKWKNNSDSEYEDEGYEDEEYQNEVPPPAMSQEFIAHILDVKHKLYDAIVLSPKLETPEAQNPAVLQEYLNKLNTVYVMAINAQNGQNDRIDKKILEFPPESQESIRSAMKWIRDYFRSNMPPDTIPYSDFIRKSLNEYQFDQRESFTQE